MRKFSADEKIQICEEYLLGKKSSRELCDIHWPNLEKPPGIFWSWISRYRKQGCTAFFKGNGNRSYTKEIKERAVKEYLAGTGSLLYICEKYDIPSDKTLIKWIKQYNANMELKDYEPKREVYMAESRRKTTLEERREIVDYCISHNNDYKGTAVKYDVSYSQVYDNGWGIATDAGIPMDYISAKRIVESGVEVVAAYDIVNGEPIFLVPVNEDDTVDGDIPF